MKKRNQTPAAAMARVTAGSSLLLASMAFYSCSYGESEGINKEEYQQEQTATPATPTTTAATPAAAASDDGKGVGPVKDAQVGEGIDASLASTGKELFEGKCAACHQLSDQKVIGPGLAHVTERRKPEWVMNMILNPEEMTKEDPTAKALLAEHNVQMANLNLNQEQARAILEYFRQQDKAS
ncbi:c-type cytochrome [Pontibacter chitinilyticus]|uniref:c-type cytochrome n=1 Tax=Pontibacter chitinilyticus TaxID=2674989 RepID=UPI00321C38C7